MTATILLGDADPLSRRGWEALLRDQGYSVIAHRSGEDLLDSCPRVRPDLILINASSPNICGPEICRRLKADQRNRLTPVILITNLSDTSDSSSTSEISADDLWRGAPSRWEVLNRLHSLLQIKSYIDEQTVSVITSLARSIEGRDPYTKGHCDRLSILAARFGKNLDMCTHDLESLNIAASVHDVGKVIIPDAILFKPGWLTLDEIKIMEQHPIEGERICSPLKSLRDVLPIIRHHHERMDGSGYPDGLRRSLIPFGARVLQIVDIYDALTTDRAYRKAVTVQSALTTLSMEADRGWLDAGLVRRFALLVVASHNSYVLAYSHRMQKSAV